MKIRKLIKAIFFVSALINLSPSSKATQLFATDSKKISLSKNVNWVNKVIPKNIDASSNKSFPSYKYNNKSNSKYQISQTHNDESSTLLANSFDNKNELDIQSEIQSEENNILTAKGNVLATFKGNSLKTDRLIYDKLNQTLKAEGNIKLILKEQVFVAEKIEYDFKSQKGNFLKVKGLIKTESLIENLNFQRYDSAELSSILQKIRKVKVLNTPNGVNNWIFYTDELKVTNNQWLAEKAIFTNDLLESDQVKIIINNFKIIPKKDELKLKSSVNYLVLEDKLPIPFWFGNRTFKESEEGYLFGLKPRWYLGLDKEGKDGYFIGRQFDSIELSDDFKLNVQPQFLFQRSFQGYTKSFVGKQESVTSNKVKRDISFADYFALETELTGKVNKWDLKIEKKLNSFDSEKFLDAVRLKADLVKEVDFLGSKWDKSLYGVYRDRIWNGSIGESEIYLGYGLKLEKTNSWEIEGISKTEKINIGLGNFKGEDLNSKNLVDSYRGSLFYSLDQKYPLIVRDTKNKYVDNSFEYIFEPVRQGIYLNTKLAALYSFYENGNHQEYVGFGAGPEFIFGNFRKKYFDYTRVNLLSTYKMKGGDSIFKFDQISDRFTLDIAFDQQVYGPILLKTNATINLDGNSKNYGDFINSKIALNWKKRSYEFGIFYQPHNKAGGVSFTLFGFE